MREMLVSHHGMRLARGCGTATQGQNAAHLVRMLLAVGSERWVVRLAYGPAPVTIAWME